MSYKDETDRLNAEAARVEAEAEAARERGESENRRATSGDRFRRFQSSARGYSNAKSRRENLRAQLRLWRARNPEYRDATATKVTNYASYLLALLAVLVIDQILLGDAGREMARPYLRNWDVSPESHARIVLVVVFILALAYISLEVTVGNQMASERAVGRASLPITAFAILLWMAFPLIIVGLTIVNSGLVSNSTGKVIGPATVTATIVRVSGIGLVAFVTHGFVWWAGARIAAAVGFVYYKIREHLLRRRINRSSREIDNLESGTEGGFREYYEDVNDSGNAGGPIGERVRTATNEVFGREVIEGGPGTKAAPGDAPGDDGPARNDANTNRESGGSEGAPRPERTDARGNRQAPPAYDPDGEDQVRE
jgi:hypothetical protein